MAWVAGDGSISFRKGIKFKHMMALLNAIEARKATYFVHFRSATQGAVCERLCQPFPLTTDWDKLGQVRADGLRAVMAHNGTWRGWESNFKQSEREWIKTEDWSDSAVIAWMLANQMDVSLPQAGYGNRLAFLSKKSGLKLWGDGWKDEDGISFSNTFWRARASSYFYASEEYWGLGGVGNGWNIGTGRRQRRKKDDKASTEVRKISNTGFYLGDRFINLEGNSWCIHHRMMDKCWAANDRSAAAKQLLSDILSAGACEIKTTVPATQVTIIEGRRVAGPDETVIGNRIYRKGGNGSYLIATNDRVGDPIPVSGNAEDRAATDLAKKKD